MYNNFYDSAYYGTESINEAATYGSALLGLFAGIWIFSLILSLIYIISYWKIFKKANKPGWASIVPIYNIIVMLEIAKLPMWYIALFFVPIANIYAIFKINIEIAKKFGKETGFGIGMTLLAIIFIPLLAFSDNNYEDNNMETSTENNSFDPTNVINNNANETNVNLNNQFNTIEPSMEVENNNIEVAAPQVVPTVENDLNNRPVENVEINVEPSIPTVTTEPVVEPVNTIEPMNNIPQYEPVDNNINEEIVTPQVETVQSLDNVNLDKEPVENIEANVEPVIATAPVVEEQIVPNAFNSTPITETVSEPATTDTLDKITNNEVPVNNIVEQSDTAVVPETLETINIEPEINVVSEPISEPVINEPITDTLNNNTLTDNKFCKNCGNELPNIVSICPNCGTDNE